MAKSFSIFAKADNKVVAGPGASPLAIKGLAAGTAVTAGTYYAKDVTEGKDPSPSVGIPAFTVPAGA